MKTIVFAFPITGLITDKLDKHFTLDSYFHLLTDKNLAYNKNDTLRRIIDEMFAKQLGVVSVGELLNSDIFYLEIKIRDDWKYSLLLFGAGLSDIIVHFLCCLWFIRDNSVNLKGCYVRVLQDNIATDECFLLRPAQVFSSCNCETIETDFSFEELKKTHEITKKLGELMVLNKKKSSNQNNLTLKNINSKAGLYLGDIGVFNHHGTNRISRAFSFLFTARTCSDVLLKISLYMNAYECLFTTNATEIAHKMAERVAYYSGEDKKNRLAVFELIKDAYNVRSRYLHGKESDEKTTLAKIIDILTRLDSLTRRLFTKIILEDSEMFLKKDHDLESYFSTLMFS